MLGNKSLRFQIIWWNFQFVVLKIGTCFNLELWIVDSMWQILIIYTA